MGKPSKRKYRVSAIRGIVFVSLFYLIFHEMNGAKIMNDEIIRSSIDLPSTISTTTAQPDWIPYQKYTNPHNTQAAINRGANLVNSLSGCQMSAWVYRGGPKQRPQADNCVNVPRRKKIFDRTNVTALLKDGDTIFLTMSRIIPFIVIILPQIQHDIVIITNEFETKFSRQLHNSTIHMPIILNHPHVLKWFFRDALHRCRVPSTSPPHLTANNHKCMSFPLGVKPHRAPVSLIPSRNPLVIYRQFLIHNMSATTSTSSYYDQQNKPNDLFFSYLSITNKNRENITRGERCTPMEYINQMSKARYVFSPNGDSPDCHRHYEALSVGTIPITELDPNDYPHFIDFHQNHTKPLVLPIAHATTIPSSAIVYNNTDWNVDSVMASIKKRKSSIIPNRNMIYEEYYMEYIEYIVQRPLNWWDVLAQKQSRLVDFQEHAPHDYEPICYFACRF